jgi:hypothetical protein
VAIKFKGIKEEIGGDHERYVEKKMKRQGAVEIKKKEETDRGIKLKGRERETEQS